MIGRTNRMGTLPTRPFLLRNRDHGNGDDAAVTRMDVLFDTQGG